MQILWVEKPILKENQSEGKEQNNHGPKLVSVFVHFNTTVEPPNKGHFGNGPLVLCSEVVPISEVHDFSIHFDCIILNKLVIVLKCMIRAVEMIIKWLVRSVFSVNIAQAEFVFKVLAGFKANIIIAYAA